MGTQIKSISIGFFGQIWPFFGVNQKMQWAISWNTEFEKIHTIVISEYVFVIPNFVKIVSVFVNQQVTKTQCKLVGTSEAIRPLTYNSVHQNILNSKISENSWNQWLSGVIDGDGCFLISKKGYMSLEITMDLRDEHALYQIKQKLGGSVKLRAGSRSIRYRLHHKKGMIELCCRVNGNIRNTIRLEQFKLVLEKLCIKYIEPICLSINNSWFAGFFDADGTVTISIKGGSPQRTISVSAKKKEDLYSLRVFFKGNIYYDKGSQGYKWSIQSKKDNLYFLDYVKANQCRSSKKYRFWLIPRYYELKSLKAYKAEPKHVLYKAWEDFREKWQERLPQNSEL